MWLYGFRGIPGMQQSVQPTAPNNTSCALIVHRSTEGQWNVWRFPRIHVKECSFFRCHLAKEQYALHRTCFSLSATKTSHTHSTFKFLGRDKISPCVHVSKGLWAKPARAFTCKSHVQLGHHSLQYSPLAFRVSVLQSFSLTAQHPALLVYTQLDKGWEWKASPSCSICDWKNTMEELIFTVTWCCPHRQYHPRSPHRSRGCLLAQSTALYKDKATMPCHKQAWSWFCRTEPSLQDCPVHSPSVLVHTLHLLCFTPPFNGTPRKTESLSGTERIYWLHLLKNKYKRLCSKCP